MGIGLEKENDVRIKTSQPPQSSRVDLPSSFPKHMTSELSTPLSQGLALFFWHVF